MPPVARRVLVTGASGFIGLRLCELLLRSGAEVTAAVRRESGELKALASQGALRQVLVGELGDGPDWSAALAGADSVVHLAARVHVMRAAERAGDALFRRVNVDATMRLAEAAARARARRLVFVSSAKAGEGRGDAYSRSKAEAEQLLERASREYGLECVIVRPPLVYGPRVRANFLRLMKLVDSGVPLPLAAVDNRRSLVFVGNLAHALGACIELPGAAGRTFSVSDGEDVSTPELVRRIARALDRPARLFPFPPGLLRAGAALLGQGQAIDRLLGDLCVDSLPIRSALGWQPPHTMEQGLAETAAWYRSLATGVAAHVT